MDIIITAIIGGLCTAIPATLATILSNKKSNAIMVYRIDQLETKVNKHNNLIERMFNAEKDIALIKEELKEMKGVR